MKPFFFLSSFHDLFFFLMLLRFRRLLVPASCVTKALNGGQRRLITTTAPHRGDEKKGATWKPMWTAERQEKSGSSSSSSSAYVFKLKDAMKIGANEVMSVIRSYHASTGKYDIINTPDKNGWNVVMSACSFGKGDVLTKLLALDPDLSLVTNTKRNALMLAVSRRHVHVVEALLKHLAERKDSGQHQSSPSAQRLFLLKVINQSDHNGFTPLISALLEQDYAIASMLLKYGADPNHTTLKGESAIITVAGMQNTTSFLRDLIAAGANVMTRNKARFTALHAAVSIASYDNTLLLIESGAQIDTPTASGHTPLALAVNKNDYKISELLIQRGASVDHVVEGWSLVSTAAKHGFHAILRLLIDNGANVRRASQPHSLTPLMLAAVGNHTECVRILLEKDRNGLTFCDPHAISPNGYTALISAAKHGATESVRLLLSSVPDLDLEVQNKEKKTALLIAMSSSQTPSDLNDHDPTSSPITTVNQDYEIVRLLVDAGARTDAVDEKGNGIIASFLFRRSFDAVLFLLNHPRIDLSQRHLHYQVKKDRKSVV